MLNLVKLLPIAVLLISLGSAYGQTDASVAQGASAAQPAAGSTTTTPLGGIDDVALMSETTGKWFYRPELYGLEQVGTAVGNEAGGTELSSITRGYGRLLADRKWSHYGLGLGALAGGSIYSSGSDQFQEAGVGIAQQEFNWKQGQLQMVDVFSYLPQGSFGGIPFGGLSLFQIGMGDYLSLFAANEFGLLNPSQFASFGDSRRRSNVLIGAVDQEISSRAAITALASYGTLHFYEEGLLDDQQETAQIGYNYALSHRSQIALIGAYQNFGLQGNASVLQTEFAEVIYQRLVSRRLSLTGGGGPAVSNYSKFFTSAGRQWSGVGLGEVAYELRSARLTADYLSYINGGSGYLLGAHTNRAIVGVEHDFGRSYAGRLSLGYAQNSAIQQEAVPTLNLPLRRSFDSAYVDLHLSHQMTAHLTVFATYTLSQEHFNAATPCSNVTCGVSSYRQTGGVGLSWDPTATRLH